MSEVSEAIGENSIWRHRDHHHRIRGRRRRATDEACIRDEM